jgi:2-iminoacetate synthase ThiH
VPDDPSSGRLAALRPKLAQVAIAYGANDIDGVAVVDQAELGPRRSAREEIERQIRAVVATPVGGTADTKRHDSMRK